jgi:outer membrane protein OmpA-like peptidoglycan-associated protein/osmotically-inducible protein OsmY
MHQPRQWLVGVGPIAGLWLAGCLFRSGPIEADIKSHSWDVLAATLPATAGDISVTAQGRDVLIEGPEFEAGQGDRAALAILRNDGVRLVVQRLHQVQTAKPFAFSAVRAGNEFTLSGSVPSPSLRRSLLAAASSGAAGATIVDKMAYALGAPDGFEAIATRGLTEAAKLDGGAFSLVDAAYSISGTAKSSEAFEAAISATHQLPAGAILAKADIAPAELRPPSLTVTSDGAAATMVGIAPSIEARAALAAAAAAALPGRTIVNQMAITRGTPHGDFAAWVSYGLSELGRLTKGSVAISDGTYSIEGEAGTSEAYEAAIAGTSRLPAGLKLARAEILAPEIKPYTWEATSDSHAVTLSGFAPSPDIRAAVMASAAQLFPGRTIVNQIGIARGAPNGDFAKAAAGVLTELAKLTEGEAAMTDAQVRITGQGPAGSSAMVSASARGSMPTPFSVAAVDIKEPAISKASPTPSQEPASSPEPAKPQEAATSPEPAKPQDSATPPEPAKPQESVASPEPAKPQDSATPPEPAKPQESAASPEPAKSQEAATSPEPAKPQESAASPEPAKPQQSAISSEPAKSQESATSPESAKSQEPAKLPEPTKSQERAKSQELAKSPFEFIIEKDDGRIKLSGTVPDDKARGDLIAAAKAVFAHDAVVDELKVGKDAPENLTKALKAIFPSLARLRSGTLTLNDAGLTAHGLVDDKNVADEIKTALADATPSGFKMGDVTIGVRPSAPALEEKACQPASDGSLLKGRILFNKASSKINEEAQPSLDNLIDVARRCRDAHIEVSGYTDYLGYDDFNIDLSKRRAQAVVEVVTRAGIDASRITSAGYGESKPAVSNDTHEGRVQNRRIEFLVK